MKPIFEKVPTNGALHMHEAIHPYFTTPLHYHPEIEILYITKGTGTRIIGDSIQHFEEGDLVMVGSGLPHVWKNDLAYTLPGSSLQAHALVIHFLENCFGETFFSLPECEKVKQMFAQAQYGIFFGGNSAHILGKHVQSIFNHTGVKRIFSFLELLYQMSETTEKQLLSKSVYVGQGTLPEYEKINKVYDYLMVNYRHKVTLTQVAGLVKMSETYFCRFFKKHTHKSFNTVLSEIRIGQACKLLSQKYTATQACYESGFNNYAHFNTCFKQHTSLTPLKFQQKTSI